MALKKIWNLPVNTHCDIIPLVTSQLPIDIQLKCRFLKFYKTLIKSENTLISYLAKLKTFSSLSTMSNNLNHILSDLDLDIFELKMLSYNKIKKLYHDKWLNSVSGLYKVHSKYIYDLCTMKERVFFNNRFIHECDFFIKFFCTL